MVKIKKLDCGVRVAMEVIPHVQSVSMGIWVKTGAVDENPKNSGVSHFIEHMLFKGTEKRTAKQIAEDVDKIGGQMNAFTGKEATCYYMKTLSSNVEKAAEILLDMFINSKFDKTEMTKERRVICEEMKMIEDSPEDDVHDIISELVFKGNPLSKSIIGTPTSLKGISRNVLIDYINSEYTRDSIVIAVAGNFDEDAVCAIFEGQLKNLTASKSEKKYDKVPFAPGFKVKVKDIEQSHICLGTMGVKLDDEDYYAFSILNNIMGGSMSSRFFQNIREEKGLAYSVYSMSSSFKKMGYYNIYAGVSHEKIKDAIFGIKEELQNLSRDFVTVDELSTAKEQMKASYIFSQENVGSRMFVIGKNETILNRTFSQEEVIAGIDSVKMEDIEKVSSKISDISNYCGAIVTNKKINLKGIVQG